MLEEELLEEFLDGKGVFTMVVKVLIVIMMMRLITNIISAAVTENIFMFRKHFFSRNWDFFHDSKTTNFGVIFSTKIHVTLFSRVII